MDSLRPVPDLRELLRHATWLRELVAPLLAGSDAVEDVLQETFTAALEKPPRSGTQWRAWLARVAWNRAQRTRRETHRRTARELQAARSEAVPAADRVVAEFELQAKLAAAVLALEPNAQRAILLRYYEGMPPRAIAAELRVPVTTVKGYLQRGIEKLREQLVRDLGADWRGALAPLALLSAVAPAASIPLSTATLALGALMQAKLAVGLLALASLGVVGWLAWSDERRAPRADDPRQLVRNTTLEVNDPGSTRGAKEIIERNPDASTHTGPSSAQPAPDALPQLARIAGRCIDASGVPLAGVQALLHGWPADSVRMDAYRRTGAALLWRDPERIVTDTSGRFAFEFDPPPAHEFALDLRSAGYAEARGRWSSWERGHRLELGDIRLVPGCAVTGRVVDTKGVLQVGMDVRFEMQRESSPSTAPVSNLTDCSARSAEDGTFRVRELIAPGLWDPRCIGRTRPKDEPLAIAAGQREAFVELVLEEVFRGWEISGVVVDEGGKPIRNTEVGPEHHAAANQWTDDEGRFRITQIGRDLLEPVRLRAWTDGFESHLQEKATPWNTENVRIVLQRGIEFDVGVRAAESNEPIEEYGMRLIAQPGTPALRIPRDSQRRDKHAQGVLRVPAVARGRYWLLVDPIGAAWSPSALLDVEVRDGMARVEVELHRLVPVSVRVEDLEHRPREGSLVSLLDAFGTEKPRIDSRIESLDSNFLDPSGTAVLIAEGRTNAQGEVALRAPAQRELSILIRGALHPPAIHGGIVLEADQRLVYAIAGGARIVGRIEPAVLAEQLWRAAGLDARDEPFDAEALRTAPRMELRRRIGEGQEIHPRLDTPASLERDGSFEIAGIPPGDWSLRMESFRRGETVHAPRMSQGIQRDIIISLEKIADLRDSEVREIVISRPDLVFAELSGTVFLDGEPFAGRDLQLLCRRARELDLRQIRQIYSTTDAAGRFSVLLEAGTCQVQGRFAVQVLNTCFDLPAQELVTLSPGQKLESDFHIQSGELKLRVLDPARKPVAGLRLYVCCEAFEHRIAFPLTDAEGRTLGRMPAGEWRLETAKQGDEKTRIEVGRLRVAAGQRDEEERELRLPASWSGR